jgi:hypothetical protein
MHIHSTIQTAFGPRLLPPAPMVRVNLTRYELDALIRILDRDAVQAQQDGRVAEADRLAVRAGMLRHIAR